MGAGHSSPHMSDDGKTIDPHVQIDIAPFLVFPLIYNAFVSEEKQFRIMTGIPPFNPFKTSTMLSMVAVWMAFNLIGIVIMIVMIDAQGNGIFGKGMINSIQSAVLRWMTMGAVATSLRVNHSHYEPDGQGGWELKKSVPMNGGNKSNKSFKALLYLYLFATLSMCFIIGLIFPKQIKDAFVGQLGIPMSNVANLPGGMNANINQFTEFIHSRHKKQNTNLMSDEHLQYLNGIVERNETINNGINLFDKYKDTKKYNDNNNKPIFGTTSKKPRHVLGQEFNTQYYVSDSERKATQYTCVNRDDKDKMDIIPSEIC